MCLFVYPPFTVIIYWQIVTPLQTSIFSIDIIFKTENVIHYHATHASGTAGIPNNTCATVILRLNFFTAENLCLIMPIDSLIYNRRCGCFSFLFIYSKINIIIYLIYNTLISYFKAITVSNKCLPIKPSYTNYIALSAYMLTILKNCLRDKRQTRKRFILYFVRGRMMLVLLIYKTW